MKSLDLKKTGKIGIIRLSAIGDVVLTLPAISAIKKSFPHIHLTYITEPPAEDILECCPYVDKIITLDFKRWKRNILKFSTWKEIIDSFKKLKSEKIDIVINFHLMLRAAITAFISAPIRAGIKSKRELNHLFINYEIPQNNSERHIIEKNLYMVKCLGAKTDEIDFSLKTPVEERRYIDDLLNQSGIGKNEKIIIMVPGASKEVKQWKLEYHAKLIDLITNRFCIKMVLDGSKEQISMLEEISSQCSQKPVITGGKTSLKHLMSLLERAILYIGSDTAAMHLAVAKKVPTVVIWTPLNFHNPKVLGPYGNGHTLVRKTLSCSSSCPGLENCKTKECLDLIKPKEVFETVELQLKKTSVGMQ